MYCFDPYPDSDSESFISRLENCWEKNDVFFFWSFVKPLEQLFWNLISCIRGKWSTVADKEKCAANTGTMQKHLKQMQQKNARREKCGSMLHRRSKNVQTHKTNAKTQNSKQVQERNGSKSQTQIFNILLLVIYRGTWFVLSVFWSNWNISPSFIEYFPNL